MTDEEATKQLNGLIKCMNLNKKVNVTLYKEDKEAIATVLNLIEKKQSEIKKYKEMYAVSVADRVNSAFKQEHKNNEDLEMLYKGCQIEIEKKDKMIDEMAKYIAGLDIEEDICVKTGRLGECDSIAYGECEACIKQYFKNKVETEEK